MQRHENWSERLEAFFAERRELVFEWGTNDCALFAADAVLLITGEDLAAEYRGRYGSAKDALNLIKEADGLDAIATVKLGDRIDWRLAQRGDVVLVDMEGRRCLGVCDGVYVAGPGSEEMLYLPMSDSALAAWKI